MIITHDQIHLCFHGSLCSEKNWKVFFSLSAGTLTKRKKDYRMLLAPFFHSYLIVLCCKAGVRAISLLVNSLLLTPTQTWVEYQVAGPPAGLRWALRLRRLVQRRLSPRLDHLHSHWCNPVLDCKMSSLPACLIFNRFTPRGTYRECTLSIPITFAAFVIGVNGLRRKMTWLGYLWYLTSFDLITCAQLGPTCAYADGLERRLTDQDIIIYYISN